MLKIVNSFIGVSPHNKSLSVDNNTLHYISSSNLIIYNNNSISKIYHFNNILNCISTAFGLVALGDISGNITILNRYSENIGSKIVDCCFLNSSFAIFCTFDHIFIFNCSTFEKLSLKVDFMISSVSTTNSTILIGSNLGLIYLYTFNNNSIQFVSSIEAHMDCIKNIRTNKNFIATCSQDYNLKIWTYNNSNISLLQTLNGHSDWVNGVFWNNDDLYSVSSDKTLRIWKKNDNGFYSCYDIIGATSELLSTAILNEKLIFHTKTGGIDIYEDNNTKYLLSGHLNEVVDLDWKDNLLLSCSTDKTVRIFDINKECGRVQIHGFPMTTAKFLPTDRLRVISAGQETIIRIFEATKAFFRNLDSAKFNIKDDYVESAYLSELNLTNEILTESIIEPLSECFLSSNVFKECQKIYGHYFEIKNISVGKDLILSCNRSAVKKFAGLFVWDLNGNKLQYLEEHDLDIQKIAISPDQSYAITVGRDGLVVLYSIINNKLKTIKRFNEHNRIVWDCRFSKDSKYFSTCSRDGKVILYSTFDQLVIKIKEFTDEITSIDFSPKEDLIILGTNTGEILCVDYNFNILSNIKVVSKKINIARFNEEGDFIGVGGSDGLLRILKL